MISDSTIARHADLDPDVRLMLAVRDGDPGAFEQLVARYQARLVTILRHWLDDPVQVEDLVQEVFLRIYRAPGLHTDGTIFHMGVYDRSECCPQCPPHTGSSTRSTDSAAGN